MKDIPVLSSSSCNRFFALKGMSMRQPANNLNEHRPPRGYRLEFEIFCGG
jgi:hypothetical protein